MLNIAELVSKQLTSLNFNRSKVAKAIQEQIEADGTVTATRGIMATIYNEIDKCYAELRKNTKVMVIRSKENFRLNSDMEIQQTLSEFGIVEKKFNETQSLGHCMTILDNQRKAYVKKPTLNGRKKFHRIEVAINSLCFQLLNSKNPEDVTYAGNCQKAKNNIMEAIRQIQVA